MGIGERFSVAGKSVLITGATRGLGWAMAQAFAEGGATVLVSSRHADACEQRVAELRARGGSAFAFACHVGRWQQVDELVAAAMDQVGTIDVLINNAGSSPTYDSPTAITEELFDRVIGVNLKGPLRLCALVGEHMAAGRGGAIINIGSTGSIRPTRNIIPYAAAKAGLQAMTVAFADAYGPTVRVNALIPGRFRTDVTAGWDEEALRGLRSRLGRIGEPDEIVGAALYLASDASSYVTASTMVLDGGSY